MTLKTSVLALTLPFATALAALGLSAAPVPAASPAAMTTLAKDAALHARKKGKHHKHHGKHKTKKRKKGKKLGKKRR